ncbi:MAG: S41 family peptidase [Solirubrobacteraceae bacterium]|jgi:carboxyl-terminal processing protease
MQPATEKIILTVLAAMLLLVGGIWWGGHPADLPPFLRNAFVANPHGTTLDQAIADIEHDYFRPLNQTKLTNAAIAGAVASLNDPYATYDTPHEFDDFATPPPKISGIGVEVRLAARRLLVEDVIPHSPAQRGGVEAGDIILAVNGHALTGRSLLYATSVIRGKAGSVVRVLIERGSRHLTLTLKRALVTVPLVTGVIERSHGVKVGVIELPTFDVEGIHNDVASTLKSLLHKGAKGFVLDLRDNGGGLVSEARLVASLFIRHGVIVTTRGRNQPAITQYATGDPLAPTQPMAVLVNGDTASAAEIVAGALRDDHRATIVGTHTYGKGVYQEVRQLSNGGAIDITVGEYFLPDGENLGRGGLRRGGGITPNVVVRSPVTASRDPALALAVALVAARVH